MTLTTSVIQFIWFIIPLAGIFIICAILLVFLLMRKMSVSDKQPQKVVLNKQSQSVEPKPAPDSQFLPPAPVVDEAKSKIEDFAGCFEPLHRAAMRGTADSSRLILQEVGNRIRHFNGCEQLKDWMTALTGDNAQWDEPTARARVNAFMQLLAKAGLQKDTRQTVTVDADTPMCYYHDDLDEMPVGETYRVKSPCWTFNGKVLEKGILRDN